MTRTTGSCSGTGSRTHLPSGAPDSQTRSWRCRTAGRCEAEIDARRLATDLPAKPAHDADVVGEAVRPGSDIAGRALREETGRAR